MSQRRLVVLLIACIVASVPSTGTSAGSPPETTSAAAEARLGALPDVRVLGHSAISVGWDTATPSDARVDYGTTPAYGRTVTDARRTTHHDLVLHGLVPGAVYFLKTTARAASGMQTTQYDVYPMPAQLATLQFPAPQSFASGTVHIKAAPGDPSIAVRMVGFFYRRAGALGRTPISVDRDGEDELLNTFHPAPTGDGWSAYWDTRRVPNGTYEISADLDTAIGTLSARETVYVDQTPPIPHLEKPAFGEAVEADVSVLFDRAPGKRALVEVKPQQQVVRFRVEPMNQHDYKYDGKNGDMMCDPTAEASILWSYQAVRDFFRGTGNCKGKTGAALDACAKDLLVHELAKLKGTGKTGTRYDNEVTGATAILEKIGLATWKLRIAEYKTHPMTFKDLKFQATFADGGKEVKGIIIHAQPKGHPNRTGHALAVISIDDAKDKDGKHEVHVMDPDTGKDVTLMMDDDGNFEYPPNSGNQYNVDSTSTFTGSPSDKLASRAPALLAHDDMIAHDVIAAAAPAASPGWAVIARLRGPSSTWKTVWHPVGQHGYYWIRVTVSDAAGRSGFDVTEVLLP